MAEIDNDFKKAEILKLRERLQSNPTGRKALHAHDELASRLTKSEIELLNDYDQAIYRYLLINIVMEVYAGNRNLSEWIRDVAHDELVRNFLKKMSE